MILESGNEKNRKRKKDTDARRERRKDLFKSQPPYTISAHPHKEEKKKNADIEEGRKCHQQEKKEAKAQNEVLITIPITYSSCSNFFLLHCLTEFIASISPL